MTQWNDWNDLERLERLWNDWHDCGTTGTTVERLERPRDAPPKDTRLQRGASESAPERDTPLENYSSTERKASETAPDSGGRNSADNRSTTHFVVGFSRRARDDGIPQVSDFVRYAFRHLSDRQSRRFKCSSLLEEGNGIVSLDPFETRSKRKVESKGVLLGK